MKRTIKFNLFPKKVGGVLVECRPIRMRVCYAGYRVDFRVGYSIEPEKWNEEEGRVISNTKNRFRQTAGEINKAITACEEQIEALYYLVAKYSVSSDWLLTGRGNMFSK